jgi:hypothetical protein
LGMIGSDESMRSTSNAASDAQANPVTGGCKAITLSHGIVVALIGPDGVGKSSQTARLTAILQQDFNCTSLYLGSGDGGWKVRRIAKQLFRKIRGRREANPAATAPDHAFGTNHSLFTGLSGLLSAVERLVTMRRAMRLARSGSLVICDRWPQNLQPGVFDGPLRLDPKVKWTVKCLSRLENHLYRRMEKYVPHLTIHLLSDFATSEKRKPGDRTPADFNQRLALMQEMRVRDPRIKIVDARKEFDAVTGELLTHLIEHLSLHCGLDSNHATAGRYV